MNVVMRNFLVSMVTVIIAGLALWSSEEGGSTANIPWLLLAGFGAGCIVFSFVGWWRRRAAGGTAGGAAPQARKKGRR